MTTARNISETERWASAVGGAVLALYGIRRRSPLGVMLAASGGALLMRGTTGYCPAYASLGVNTATTDSRERLAGNRGTLVDASVTINRAHDELYQFWRRLENLPQFMSHLISVTQIDNRRSHWIARGPAGKQIEWDAEIINDQPNELVGWRTLANADVVSAGAVTFKPIGKDNETVVRVRMQYDPPAGKLGSAIAWTLGDEPSQIIREDLRRLKALMEAGEVPTNEGQPRGRQSILNYD